MTQHLDALQRVLSDVVAPEAAAVDRDGTVPQASIDALAGVGLLGLTTSAELGGGGQGMRPAAEVIQGLAGTCGSTAMIVLMHYTANAAIEGHASEVVRKAVASGQHLSTLAFSEAGSRSHFWASQSTAAPASDDVIVLDAAKSWVTAAAHADSYVWSTRPVDPAAEGPMTLWLVPSAADGLVQPSGFDGLGLRGNGSTPVTAKGVRISRADMLGLDGGGFDLALGEILPWFLVLSGAFCLGLMEAVTAETGAHLTGTRLEHLDQTLVQQQLPRVDHARMRLRTDQLATLLGDTLTALETARPDAMLRVLEIKAAAAEAAIAVTDLAMKVCGGAAFRKELGIERAFRDARAARVMAPTTDALLDFIGR
ncbi:MAG: acyl-CoA dehydrogenase family protein, partial [Acidimicrobiales bacterium]